MSLLPRGYLDTTVAIETMQAAGSPSRFRTIGTGFFIGLDYGDRSAGGVENYRLFLVTNRHVIAGHDDLLIRINTKSGAAQRVRLSLKDNEGRSWAVHPDRRVDIAVVLINARALLQAGLDLSYFRPSEVAYVATMKTLDIGPGQDLFVLGFPMGMSGVERNYVIARSGIVARLDDEILSESRTFLIDASVFPGNSGGPVIVKPSSESLAGGRPIDQAYLIGTVRSYLPYEEVAYSLQTDPPTPRMVFTENSGLADVIPMDCVKEAADTLADPRLRLGSGPGASVERPVILASAVPRPAKPARQT
jgi:Trypsin-like peptidase domain